MGIDIFADAKSSIGKLLLVLEVEEESQRVSGGRKRIEKRDFRHVIVKNRHKSFI